MIGKNFEDFTQKVVDAEAAFLNGSEMGQELTKKLLKLKLEQNPNMAQEEWSKTKQEFMVFIFREMMKANPELLREMGGHLYDKLNAQ